MADETEAKTKIPDRRNRPRRHHRIGYGLGSSLVLAFVLISLLFLSVTGRAVRLGGIDMSKKEPKPLTPALPAGTVIHARNMTVKRVLHELGGGTEDTLRRGMGLAVTWAR